MGGLRQALRFALVAPLILLLIGTTGFVLIEDWPIFDALYMTVTTLTTIGFQEVHPLSTLGRVFTMVLALGGIFALFYAGAEVMRAYASGELRLLFGRQRMEKKIASLSNHVVVCGYGRMGHLVCEEFSSKGIPFVVIERNEEALEGFSLPHGYPLQGDATSDEVLRRAQIGHARAVVAVVASDADNLFITMSARLLAENVPIVARSEDEHTGRKLMRAGATRVVSPYVIGGTRVAQAVLRPAVLDFIEVATRSEHLELQIEEVNILAQSPLAQKSVEQSRLRAEHQVILVAIKKATGKMVFNPTGETQLEANDTLIMLGRRDQLDRVEALAAGLA